MKKFCIMVVEDPACETDETEIHGVQIVRAESAEAALRQYFEGAENLAAANIELMLGDCLNVVPGGLVVNEEGHFTFVAKLEGG